MQSSFESKVRKSKFDDEGYETKEYKPKREKREKQKKDFTEQRKFKRGE